MTFYQKYLLSVKQTCPALCFFTAIVFSFSALWGQNLENPVQRRAERYDQALRLIQNKQVDSAIVLLRSLLRNPTDEVAVQSCLKLGKIYLKENRTSEAEAVLKQGLSLALGSNLNSYAARVLYALGRLYQTAANYAAATDHLLQAITLAETLKDTLLQAEASTDLGVVYRNSGRLRAARLYHEKALRLARKSNNKKLEGQNIGNLGSICFYKSDFEKALTLYEQAVKIHKKCGEQRLLGTWLTNIGLCNWNLSRYNQAESYFKQAVRIHRKVNNKREEGRTLHAMALVYWRLGNLTRALYFLRQTLRIAHETGDRNSECRANGNIGNIHSSLGNYDQALLCFKKAAEIAEAIGDRSQLGSWTGNIGSLYQETGKISEALAYYQKAMALAEETGNLQDQAIFLEDIGQIYAEQRHYIRSQTTLNQALDIARQRHIKGLEADILLSMARLEARQNHFESASTLGQKVVHMARQIGVTELVWQARTLLADNLQKSGQPRQALQQYKQAVNAIETMRSYLQTDSQKTVFMSGKIAVYEKIVALLMQLSAAENNPELAREAYYYAEKAKARALLETLTDGGVLHHLKEIPADFKQKLIAIEQDLETTYKKLAAALDSTRGSDNRDAILAYKDQLDLLQTNRSVLLEKVKQRFPRYYRLTNPPIFNIDDVQKQLTKDKTLIEFMMTKDATFVWTITQDRFQWRRIAMGRWQFTQALAEISPLFDQTEQIYAVRFDHKWANINIPQLHDLFHVLFENVELLPSGTELIIIPDDVLNYLPFEMLVTEMGQNKIHYLIETHPVSYSASASMLYFTRGQKEVQQNSLLAFGNPTFGSQSTGFFSWLAELRDKPQNGRASGFPPIPESEQEVKRIAKHFQRSHIYTRGRATESRFKQEAGAFSHIHLATHIVTEDQQPAYSGIALAHETGEQEDGFLQTYEVYNLKLNADLVTLSGCESATGKLRRGEGLVGLARAFFYAGAKSLLASLWPVNDRTTAELMSRFYQRIQAGDSKAVALQKAKKALITRTDWEKNPFYWAPFILQGNWR